MKTDEECTVALENKRKQDEDLEKPVKMLVDSKEIMDSDSTCENSSEFESMESSEDEEEEEEEEDESESESDLEEDLMSETSSTSSEIASEKQPIYTSEIVSDLKIIIRRVKSSL